MLVKFPDEYKKKIYARAGVDCVSNVELIRRAVDSYLRMASLVPAPAKTKLVDADAHKQKGLRTVPVPPAPAFTSPIVMGRSW